MCLSWLYVLLQLMPQKCHHTLQPLVVNILDTRFPLVQKSGLSKEQHQENQKNLKESKEKTREIHNRQKESTSI